MVVNQITCTIEPSFVMPYATGMVDDVEKTLFLRKFGAPFWALAYCLGKDPMCWSRQEAALGRFSIVGITIQDANLLPPHIAADEKYTWLKGDKIYCATTVARGCILGASLTGSASQEHLEVAYGVFKQEAQTLNPNYRTETGNTDAWQATRKALQALFPETTLLMCFLHIFISIRDRSSKKFNGAFTIVSQKLWNCYHARTKASFSQRVRRLCEWSKKAQFPSFMIEKLDKVGKNLPSFAQAYDFAEALRNSNMLGRLMPRMDRHLFAAQHFHGTLSSANHSIRVWALIQDFAPFNPRTVAFNNGLGSSAERPNGFCCHSNWLQNLLVSPSLRGYWERPAHAL